MSRYRSPGITPEIRHANRRKKEEELEGDAMRHRLISDNAKATSRSRRAYQREVVEEKKAAIIELYKNGTPTAVIVREVCLTPSIVSTVIAHYMLSQQPENLIIELTKLPEYQTRLIRRSSYPKHPFNHRAIYTALKDKIPWKRERVASYLEAIAKDWVERRSLAIKTELQKRTDITNQDLEEIAQIIGTHTEIVELEYSLLSGKRYDNNNKLRILAERYELTREQMYALSNSFKAPENQTKNGINFMRIGMTLERKFGRIPQLDLHGIAEIYNKEYQNQQSNSLSESQ